MTHEAWKVIMNEFKRVMTTLYPGRSVCIFLDKSRHMELSTLKSALESNIYCLFFPSHTTHFLQPEDDLIFTVFKREMHILRSKHIVSNALRKNPVRNLLQKLVPTAEEKAFVPSIIKKSFERNGIFPWNKEKIIHRAMSNASQKEIGPEKEKITEEKIKNMVIELATPMSLSTPTFTVKVKPRTAQSYSSFDLVKMDEKRQQQEEDEAAKKIKESTQRDEEKKRKREEKERLQEEKNEKKRKKMKEKEANTCKNCGKIAKSGNEWEGCEYCNAFWICSRCKKKTTLVKDHDLL